MDQQFRSSKRPEHTKHLDENLTNNALESARTSPTVWTEERRDPMNGLPVGLFETDLAGRLGSADESFRALAMSGGALPLGSAPWANAHPGDRAAAELAWRRQREAGE